jgi:hypothetical protein
MTLCEPCDGDTYLQIFGTKSQAGSGRTWLESVACPVPQQSTGFALCNQQRWREAGRIHANNKRILSARRRMHTAGESVIEPRHAAPAVRNGKGLGRLRTCSQRGAFSPPATNFGLGGYCNPLVLMARRPRPLGAAALVLSLTAHAKSNVVTLQWTLREWTRIDANKKIDH